MTYSVLEYIKAKGIYSSRGCFLAGARLILKHTIRFGHYYDAIGCMYIGTSFCVVKGVKSYSLSPGCRRGHTKLHMLRHAMAVTGAPVAGVTM